MTINNSFQFRLALACCSLLLVVSLQAAAPQAPGYLRSYDKVNPVGTDQKPYFGWFFSDPDDGELQTAYQILVSTSPEQLWAGTGDVWDSGKVLSGMQNHVEYAGRPLAAATRYYWAVRTWDKKGKAGPYSEPATFDVGLLTAADWSGAKWIRREVTDRDDYSYFRKKMALPGKEVKRAMAYISVWHNYELFVNGSLVGKGQAYHYPQYSYYNAWDITKLMKSSGDNQFACFAHWYGGGQGRAAGAAGFLMKVVVEFADGTSQVMGTDAAWKQTRPEAWVPGQGTRGGEGVGFIERIDASKINKDWYQPGFNDASWAAAVEVGAHPVAPWTGELQPDLTRLVEREIAPASVRELGPGRYVIDLGRVYAGMPRITFSGGKAGDVVSMMGGYVLNEDGTVSTVQRQSTNMAYFFVLDGKTAVFQPDLYLGMRYIQVDNAPGRITAENVRFIVRYYEMDPSRSAFHSSNETLNRVWDLMKHTILLGAQEQFVDTPTREKGAFLGDAWAQGVPAMTTMGDRAYNLRIMLEFLDSQDQYWPDGRLNAVYPNNDGKRDIPDYTQSYLVWVWDYYMLTGNVQFLRDQYLKLRKIAEYVDAYRNPETGLIHRLAGGSGAYQFGIIDWPSTMRYGYDMSAEARTVISAYAYLDYDIISRIAGVVGNEADQKLYQGKAEAMRQAINTRLLNSEGVYIDGLMADKSQSAHVSQHANMFPLAMGIVPDAHKEKVIQAVKDRKMNVGMVTLKWLPEALGRAEQGSHLVELYTNPEWDGWAQTLARGGTATWEAWDAEETRQSMSHPWGVVGLLGIQQFVLGVEPLEPQYACIRVRPLDFGSSLVSAQGMLPSDRGDISVEWQRSGDAFTMSLTIPDNMTARVYVPVAGKEGTQVRANGKKVRGTAEGDYIYVGLFGSGTHRFER